METPEERFDRVWAEHLPLFKKHVMTKVAEGVDMDRMIYTATLTVCPDKAARDKKLKELGPGFSDLALAT